MRNRGQVNPLGQRVEKAGVGVTDTIYFGGQPIARYAAGQWTDLIYGPTGLLAEVPGTQTGAPVYRVTDHLGSNVGLLMPRCPTNRRRKAPPG